MGGGWAGGGGLITFVVDDVAWMMCGGGLITFVDDC